MEVQPRDIQIYFTSDGRSPFENWLNSLRDNQGKAIIRPRLKRVATRNLGDWRSVGEGIYEFTIKFGPGYRVYFGQVGSTIVLLLGCGDKSSQEQDIRMAKAYWEDYRRQEDATVD
jgi:putative addiction module killer protein